MPKEYGDTGGLLEDGYEVETGVSWLLGGQKKTMYSYNKRIFVISLFCKC